MIYIVVRPREGLSVPDPDRKDFLPLEGREVVLNAYWQRRINDGDVFLCTKSDNKESK